MIDVSQEKLLNITQVCERCPGRNGNVVYRTVWWWMKKGVRGVKLESLMVGGRLFSSEEALHRFLAALNGENGQESNEPAESGEGPRPPLRPVRSTPARERRRQEAYADEVDRMLGIKRATPASELRRQELLAQEMEQLLGIKKE